MRKIYLDCGANNLQGFKKIVSLGEVGLGWEIHAFEPNPESRETLETEAASISRLGFNISFHNVAVGDVDGEVGFSYSDSVDQWATTCSWHSQRNFSKNVSVPQIDLAKFIRDRFAKEDQIYLKLDIEGGEFRLLEYLMEDGVFQWLDKLYVEWHVDNRWGHTFPCHLKPEQVQHYREVMHKVKTQGDVPVYDWD